MLGLAPAPPKGNALPPAAFCALSAARARTIRTRTADGEGNSTVRERIGQRYSRFGPQRTPTQHSRQQGVNSESPAVHLQLLRSSFVLGHLCVGRFTTALPKDL